MKMKHLHIVFYSLMLLLATKLTYAQEYLKNDILLPTPNVSSIFRAGNIPVNKSNGTISVNVPIFSIATSEGSSEVNLTYNTKGIKVNETASEVGLGWSLNQGGVITRTVKGKSDLYNLPYFNYVNEFKGIQRGDSTYYYQCKYAWDRETQNSHLDLEPDIYNYSFAGYSGKFYLFPDGHFYTVPASNLKIERVVVGIHNKWIITTPNGAKYYFGYNIDNTRTAMDHSTTSINSNNNPTPLTYDGPVSWFLLETVLPNKESITYDYIVKNYLYQVDVDEDYKQSLTDGGCGVSTFVFKDIFSSVSSYEIESITYKETKIEFVRNLNRFDIPGADAITSIKILSNSTLLKQYNFEYFYNTPNNIATNNGSGLGSPFNLRLFLKRITETSASTSLIYREFDYNSEVPSRFDKSRDHWGFFNGRGSNSLLPPSSFYKNLPHPVYFDGSNRSVSELHAQAMILKSVKYPTGGKTLFSYESNRVQNTTTSLPSNTQRIAQAEYENRLSDTTYFSIANAVVRDPFSNLPIVSCTIDNDEQNIIQGGCAELMIRNVNTGYHVRIDLTNIENLSTISLPEGDYMMFFKWTDTHGSCYNLNDFYLYSTLIWEEQNENPTNPIIVDEIVGGLRIAEVRDVDQDDKTISKKNFVYKEDTSELSSGHLEYDPDYRSSLIINSDCSIIIFGSNSQLPTVGASNSIVLYNIVTELDSLDTNRQIKTKDYFTTTKDFPSVPFDSYPNSSQVTVDSYEWRRGLLEKQVFYKLQNNVYEAVEEDEYTYAFIDERVPGTQSNQLFGIIRSQFVFPEFVGIASYDFTEYSISNEWTYKLASIKKSFLNNQQITETENYFYQNPLHKQLTLTTKMNSKLQIDTVINSYPHEMVSSGGDMQGIYQAMIDNGIISPLVINVQKRNGQQVRLVRKNYYQPYSGLYTVKSIDVQAKSSDPIETRLNYLKHNQQLKVQSLAQTGGSKTTYLWSYNNEYPIAEIHNADYNIIESILGQASIDFWGNKDNPTSTELAVFLAPLRTASLLKDAHIITYTYKPLVGIASMTDAKGLTTTYEYDDFQRLKCVKDHNGNIVKLYDYQYQAPITQ